jgi:hypothetical protein
MHWLSPLRYTESKFGPLEKIMKNDWHQSRWDFSEQPVPPLIWAQNKLGNFGRFESRTSWEETKKMQLKLPTTYDKNEQQQNAKNNGEV